MMFPKLSSLNFDQPEAQLVFGLQNKTGCSKCKRRRGHSAFRVGSRHVRTDIQNMYDCANDNNSSQQILARKALLHWGFNYQRKCCLLSPSYKHLFVFLEGKNEVFPCVDYRDRMHGLVIFIHRMLRETLDLIIPSAPKRRLLDRRLAAVGERAFRVDGSVIRAQRSIFTDVGMSAQDKLWMVFLLSHVFGHRGEDTEILSANLLGPLLSAIATAQLMFIAVKGCRSYTKKELELIFDRGYVDFFAALETIQCFVQQEEQEAESSEPPPKRFKRPARR